eukprot:gene25152-biopygen22474
MGGANWPRSVCVGRARRRATQARPWGEPGVARRHHHPRGPPSRIPLFTPPSTAPAIRRPAGRRRGLGVAGGAPPSAYRWFGALIGWARAGRRGDGTGRAQTQLACASGPGPGRTGSNGERPTTWRGGGRALPLPRRRRGVGSAPPEKLVAPPQLVERGGAGAATVGRAGWSRCSYSWGSGVELVLPLKSWRPPSPAESVERGTAIACRVGGAGTAIASKVGGAGDRHRWSGGPPSPHESVERGPPAPHESVERGTVIASQVESCSAARRRPRRRRLLARGPPGTPLGCMGRRTLWAPILLLPALPQGRERAGSIVGWIPENLDWPEAAPPCPFAGVAHRRAATTPAVRGRGDPQGSLRWQPPRPGQRGATRHLAERPERGRGVPRNHRAAQPQRHAELYRQHASAENPADPPSRAPLGSWLRGGARRPRKGTAVPPLASRDFQGSSP